MASHIRIKRTAVPGRKPQLGTDIISGELALNTTDGYLYTETEVAGIGLTITNLTPFKEAYGEESISYEGKVGIGKTVPQVKLDVAGDGHFDGSITIGGDFTVIGTITSEDVTDLDSIGVITARTGVNVLSGGINVTGVSTFHDHVYFGNNDRIIIGNTDDLQIYNDGNNSYITDFGVGNLHLRGTSSIEIENAAGTEKYARFNVDGAAELYYDNSKKLETIGTGVTIYNDLYVGGDLFVNDDILFDEFNSRNANISGVATVGTILDVTGHTYLDNLNVSGVSTFSNRIVGAATSNVVPFLYSNFTDLPSPVTYHGAFAHVHQTGKSYFAHAGAWYEIVSKELNGVVGSGTERYNVGPVDLTTLDVSGISTFALAVDINNDLDVDGQTELDHLNVSGVSTFALAVDINNDLDVDGHTELDNLNVSGVSTFALAVDINNDLDVDGQTELDHVNVSGVSTFALAVDINNDLDVDGHTELDGLRVSGVSTFNANLDVNAHVLVDDGHGVYFGDSYDLSIYHSGSSSNIRENGDGNLSIWGDNIVFYNSAGNEVKAAFVTDGAVDLYYDNLKKFATTAEGIDVTGRTETDLLNVSGVSTFASAVDINSDLDVDGRTELDTTNISETLNVVGVSTFGNSVDINADLDVDGQLDVDHLYVSGVSTFYDSVRFQNEIKGYDNDKIILGNSDDLEIYHSGSSSNIRENGFGNLNIWGDDIVFYNSSGNNFKARFDTDGAVSLYYDNVKRFETNGIGVTITGEADVNGDLNVSGVSTFGNSVDINADLDVDGHTNLDNVNISGVSTFSLAVDINNDLDVDGHTELDNIRVSGVATFQDNVYFGDLDILNFGAGNDLQIYHSGSSSNIKENGTGDLNIWGDNIVLRNSGGGDIKARFDTDGSTQLYYDNVKRFATNGIGVTITGEADVNGDLNVSGVSTFGNTVDINADLDVDGHTNLDNVSISGVATISNTIVGGATTELVVQGDARITGILTIGTSSVTIDGDNNKINVGTGLTIDGTTNVIYLGDDVTIDNSGLDIAGVSSITATTIYGDFDGELNAPGHTYYVSTTGDDAHTGDNANQPYLTIAKALSVATNGDIIIVAAGTYEEVCPLTIPRGVTVKGAGLRATTVKPTNATKTNNVFLFNDVSTLTDITIRDSYYDSTADTGYAFAYAPGIAITTRSPYVERITVLGKGSITSVDDPYGYDTADAPPTSYLAGRGALVDGSVVASNSLEAGFLFNEVTFFTPNNKGLVLTNGARIEHLNTFHYFSSQAVVGTSGTTGIGGTANARLKIIDPTVALPEDAVIKQFSGGTAVAIGTIVSYDAPYATISSKGSGIFTSVGAGSTQDLRVFQSDGVTQTGIATRIAFADYAMFGAEMRSVGGAIEYGAQGVVADGDGVNLRLFAINFNYVGSGKDFTNDDTLVIQANETTEIGNGEVSYVSIDQRGDFRVGESFFVDQESGNVSFAATTFDLDVTGNLQVTDGASNTSTLSPTSLEVGSMILSANSLVSSSGDITINPSGSNKTFVSGDLGVVGILTAQVIDVNALQKGDTSVALDDTGSDGTIRFNTDSVEGMRLTNAQQLGVGKNNPSVRLDVDAGGFNVDGQSTLAAVNVSSASTFNASVSFGSTTAFENDVDINASVNISTNLDVVGDLDVDGATTLDTTTIDGVLTVNTGEIHANAGLTANTAIVEDLTDNRVVIAGTGGELEDDANLTFDGSTLSVGVDLDVTGVLDVDGLSELDDVNVSGAATVAGTLDANGGLQANTAIIEDLTDNRVVIAGPGGELEDDANLTYDGTDLSANSLIVTDLTDNRVLIAGAGGAVEDDNNLTYDGTDLSANSLIVTDLTDNRVLLAGTGGAVEDDGNLTFNGAVLAVGVDLDVDGHTNLDNVSISGVSTLGNTIVGGATTELIVGGHARITGILTVGTSSLTLDGDQNKVQVGAALTLGHTIGLQYHTQRLHSDGFEVNNINATGITTSAGVINSNTDIQINGTSVLETASGDATALAIALG
jgi:hypothetical protein